VSPITLVLFNALRNPELLGVVLVALYHGLKLTSASALQLIVALAQLSFQSLELKLLLLLKVLQFVADL
jgi:hypothetical protein